jgi:septation ring formation regulator EzrA
MAEQQITTNQLAEMIKKGFDNTSTKEQYENIDKRLVAVEKDVKYIKENINDTIKLEKEVEYIRNTFSIPAMKKN